MTAVAPWGENAEDAFDQGLVELGLGDVRLIQAQGAMLPLGSGAKRKRFGQDQGCNRHTVVVLACGYFINCDIKFDDLKVPTCQATLQVSSQEQDRFFVVTVGGDGRNDGALITLGSYACRPSDTG